ncbi:FAD-binding domain protein [Methylocella silvestris BL2]|uniref:assimilatory sulfite reductase (NADPH) n=1 Tax=Methylocella silvestris (strain DSM 15510 / CIP 108128 / LMG 27833 / NCIMB 13906 / BL2) TaxID=395965 RepID=B8ELU9_METSB|nr:sulfite reductase subunit alpha [Methylocella silvestris]ACK50730.1 FAD-binding domain protein [Methylocella silvestris BL2]
MSLHEAPPISAPLIPDNAPFSQEQRAWLNGFIAGLIAPDIAAAQGAPASPPAQAEDEITWHDPSLPLAERMKLAEDKPLPLKLMAAMAQQDCGQCGYDCQKYAAAIASGEEKRLNLCAPGEKPTARMVKSLVEGAGGEAAPAAAAAPAALPKSSKPLGYARENPVMARFLSRARLNKEDSEKSTYHIEFDLSESGLDYTVGDSFGVFPANDPELVDQILAAIRAPADFPIGEGTLREALIHDLALHSAPDALFELISYIVGGERRKLARSLAKGEDPEGDASTLDVLAALQKFPGIHPDPEAFVESLEPLQPRLYSISSSPKVDPHRLSLTVDHVRYLIKDRVRRGVASSWLGERIQPGASFKAYIQRAHNFALPSSGETPIIMVGPGTGVAPFRAFLHERCETKATGGAWLFFGHQRRAADFFYEEELTGFLANGALTKLSLAWSRDGETKTYVQDKMREEALSLWEWLEKGAHFYICGDAKRMAADVERAMMDIVAEAKGIDQKAAQAFVAELKKAGRYQADVY